jgi:NAD(P)-dependent dehydrogenase (short-subunit alcohol dehydrogenase family)
MSLANQRVVIIGGSSGMGLATARAAAAAGAVVTIASSNKGRLDAALAELPGTCDAEVTDTRDEMSVAGLFDRIGSLDHLVYTAGDAFTPRPLADLPLSEARQGFEVRLWGEITAVKYAAPRIRPGGSVSLTTGTVSARDPGQRGPGGGVPHAAVGPAARAAAGSSVRVPGRADAD